MKHKFSSSPFFAPFLHIISSLYNSFARECVWGSGGWVEKETSTLCNLSKSDEIFLPQSSTVHTTQTHQNFRWQRRAALSVEWSLSGVFVWKIVCEHLTLSLMLMIPPNCHLQGKIHFIYIFSPYGRFPFHIHHMLPLMSSSIVC